MKEAMYYRKTENNYTKCVLCPHGCTIPPDKTGLCRVRKNHGGILYAENYGQISSIALDPIEKKPLRQFYPGSSILSVGSYGCNLKCAHCQNHRISMAQPKTDYLSPQELVGYAEKLTNRNNIGIAYTYNEPLIGYEYVYDCAALIRKAGLSNVLVTNGFIEPEPLDNLLPFIDAMNIDLKCYNDDFYKELGGRLESVKETILTTSSACMVEVTTLVIPQKNDSEDEMRAVASWLSSISENIPLHITRFFPGYKMSGHYPTDRDTVHRLRDVALKYLKFVYAA